VVENKAEQALIHRNPMTKFRQIAIALIVAFSIHAGMSAFASIIRPSVTSAAACDDDDDDGDDES